MNSFIKYKHVLQSKTFSRYLYVSCKRQTLSNKPHPKALTSKEIRKLFIEYFVKNKSHFYVHSSPVFLNNDPSLLFVNAGMNQFRSLLLDKTYPGHPFHQLKRAANSQKCVRLSGKHNDLKDVGVDVYHHTFFEMLGNWSFGDYSKLDACKMAWELLTDVYGLNPQNLYVTYFKGDETLGLPSDEECKQNWLELGVHPNHIFPFGAKDNFWEMGESGPCGPCTEIHYDFNSAGPVEVSQKINRNSSDVMEIWNLVFIQCKREKDGSLKSIPTLNIDTGMGFERLCAVLQGTNSNYDTDLFSPIFQAIQSNFKVRPYTGRTGVDDVDGLDTAYRIVADHARMFSIAIADGLFPDSCDAGHVLRKIIRRAAYTANRNMKTKPGVLSSLVPYVAETLNFFPEVQKNTDEIIYIIDEEEKLFHHTINKGRKARNKMILNNSGNILEGQNVWELYKVHGLEHSIIEDIASEKNLSVDWEGYEKVKNQKLLISKKQQEKETSFVSTITKQLKDLRIPLTNDSFKYNYSTSKDDPGVKDIHANLLSIFKKTNIVEEGVKGDKLILVTDNTNFYSEAGGQIASIGKIFNKDFIFKVENVTSSEGYVLHHGNVQEGRVKVSDVQMSVHKDHHLSCSQNHTATHILNAALRKVLPYTSQRSSLVSPTNLRFAFSAKSALSLEQLEKIETYVNDIIMQNIPVSRKEMTFEELLNQPNVILLHGEEYPENVSVIFIGNGDNSDISSVEPCCGIHVQNTGDIKSFIITPSKSSIGSSKYISAATGKQANIIRTNGKIVQEKIESLEKRVNVAVNDIKITPDALKVLLKEVKGAIGECQSKTDVPLLVLKKCEHVLKELKIKLSDLINTIAEDNMINSTVFSSDQTVSLNVLNYLKKSSVLPTDDIFKYDYHVKDLKPIKANILAIVKEDELVDQVERGLKCQIVLDKTNFYAFDDDQASDVGILSCNDFKFRIDNVFKIDGFVFHEGIVEEGNVSLKQNVNLSINQKHRLACSQNHTALHILNSVMKQELPYFFPVFATAGASELQLNFTSKTYVTEDELEVIENKVNEFIKAGLTVQKRKLSPDSVKDTPMYKSALLKQGNDHLPFVSINEDKTKNLPKSIEPCHGTHVDFTSEIGSFIIISQSVKDKDRIIRAVTGEQAAVVKKEGHEYDKQLSELEEYVSKQIESFSSDHLLLWDCLKMVKEAKGYHKTELPLRLFRNHQNKLSVLTKKLNDATDDFVQKGFSDMKSEINLVLERYSKNPFIVHQLKTLGDGKKIANYAVENSSNKPALYFVKDGHSSFICSCSVPASFINSSFSALLWINPVASFLNGRARTLAKDPEKFYSVVTNRVDKIDEAIKIATDYASVHMKQ